MQRKTLRKLLSLWVINIALLLVLCSLSCVAIQAHAEDMHLVQAESQLRLPFVPKFGKKFEIPFPEDIQEEKLAFGLLSGDIDLLEQSDETKGNTLPFVLRLLREGNAAQLTVIAEPFPKTDLRLIVLVADNAEEHGQFVQVDPSKVVLDIELVPVR